MYPRKTNRLLFVLIASSLAAGSALATTTKPKPKRKVHRVAAAAPAPAAAKVIVAHHPGSHLSRLPKKRYVFSPWNVPTFADSTEGDSVDGEDLMVRRAAVQALGPYNGTVVVADPNTGRILSIVNQKLACKAPTSPAPLSRLSRRWRVSAKASSTRTRSLRLTKRHSVDLTEAMARSINAFFSLSARKLGYDKIVQYGRCSA
jgi:penicillin-binding protein 2